MAGKSYQFDGPGSGSTTIQTGATTASSTAPASDHHWSAPG